MKENSKFMKEFKKLLKLISMTCLNIKLKINENELAEYFTLSLFFLLWHSLEL